MSNSSVLQDQDQDRHDPTDEDSADPGPSTDERTANSRYPMRAMATGVLGAVAVAAIGLGAWKFYDTSNDLDAMRADADARAHAEQVALDYATGAAEMDFKDLAAWKQRLTAGTAPELEQRLTQASTSMEQIIVPLQWTSTAQPITAKAEDAGNGVYTVDCFVGVFTSNAQAPEGIQSTATYKLSIDSSNDWKITEISGVGPDLDASGTPPK
ncbi:hypothetical protein [Aldersonia kunmingensis]|uniref:hypothetical protein n=1 Tax=Aldersonia kunmingensis TaxID=408066 RepID=UPI00082AFB6E|nr:hypothetical protein [Aldersonia kunmingensis]